MPFISGATPFAGIQDLLGAGTYNGLQWGPGTKFHISNVSGLHDLPPIRTFDSARPSDHGRFRGRDLLDARTITLEVTIIGTSNADYYVQANQIAAAFIVQDIESPLFMHNNTRMVYVRCRRRSIPYDAQHMDYSGVATLELIASDPRVYDASLLNLTTGLAASGGGMTFPATFPLSFGTTGAGGQVQVTNIGTFAVRPILTVTGPVDNPIIENITAGKKLRFNVSLAATDTLIVDLDAHSVLLNGTASRRSTMSPDSQWWEIAPGTSTLRYSNAGSYQAASSLAFPFRSAWV